MNDYYYDGRIITPNEYTNWDVQQQKKSLEFIVICEVRDNEVIRNTALRHYKKGSAMSHLAFQKITKNIRRILSAKLNITTVKKTWQNLRKSYVYNFKNNLGVSTYQ